MSNFKMAHLIFYQKEHRLRNGEISSFCDIRNADEFENLPCVQAKSERKKGFCYISTKSCQSKHALLIHE
eukprot:UN21454